jgi:hypothetical protein
MRLGGSTEVNYIEDRGSRIEDRGSRTAARSSILDPRSSILVFGLLLLAILAPSPAPACSLCGGYAKRFPFVNEYWHAHAVVCGTLQNPRLSGESGSGTTELHVDKLVRGDPRPKGMNVIVLPRYLTVLNPKEPPRVVILFDEKLSFFAGKQDYSSAFLDFLVKSDAVKGKPRPQALGYFAPYLDHPDPSIAEEAFLQFAQASDKEIMEVAPHLKPDVFRKLVKDPKIDAERLSLFAFLLGATGTPADGDLLVPLLQKPDERTSRALEGILSGYILRRPKEGWAWTYATLADPRQPYLVRWGIVRTLRFLYSAHPAEYRAPVLHATGLMIPSGELADCAIGDLQKWKLWDHTKLILAQYGKASHSAPIVRNALLRYALVCPLPEARQFIDEVRRREPKLVRELEEDLAFEQGK